LLIIDLQKRCGIRAFNSGSWSALDYALGDAWPNTSLVFILAVAQDLGLDPKEIGLNGAGTTHAPQRRCKPEHQLALHGISVAMIAAASLNA
jgi:hypothetical protein